MKRPRESATNETRDACLLHLQAYHPVGLSKRGFDIVEERIADGKSRADSFPPHRIMSLLKDGASGKAEEAIADAIKQRPDFWYSVHIHELFMAAGMAPRPMDMRTFLYEQMNLSPYADKNMWRLWDFAFLNGALWMDTPVDLHFLVTVNDNLPSTPNEEEADGFAFDERSFAAYLNEFPFDIDPFGAVDAPNAIEEETPPSTSAPFIPEWFSREKVIEYTYLHAIMFGRDVCLPADEQNVERLIDAFLFHHANAIVPSAGLEKMALSCVDGQIEAMRKIEPADNEKSNPADKRKFQRYITLYHSMFGTAFARAPKEWEMSTSFSSGVAEKIVLEEKRAFWNKKKKEFYDQFIQSYILAPIANTPYPYISRDTIDAQSPGKIDTSSSDMRVAMRDALLTEINNQRASPKSISDAIVVVDGAFFVSGKIAPSLFEQLKTLWEFSRSTPRITPITLNFPIFLRFNVIQWHDDPDGPKRLFDDAKSNIIWNPRPALAVLWQLEDPVLNSTRAFDRLRKPFSVTNSETQTTDDLLLAVCKPTIVRSWLNETKEKPASFKPIRTARGDFNTAIVERPTTIETFLAYPLHWTLLMDMAVVEVLPDDKKGPPVRYCPYNWPPKEQQ